MVSSHSKPKEWTTPFHPSISHLLGLWILRIHSNAPMWNVRHFADGVFAFFEFITSTDLMQLLDGLEQAAESNNATRALRALRECRTALEKQIAKMDNLELTFDKIAERSCKHQACNAVNNL